MHDITTLLEKLAAQLGTTVEYLWAVLIKQTQIELQINEFWMTVQLTIAIILAILALWALIYGKYRDDEVFYFLSFIIFLIGIIFMLSYFNNYFSNITLRTNPEYWALEQILDKIGGYQ